MGGVKSRMKAFLNKILLQIWNAEDEGKKIFIDSEELGKPIGNGEKYYHWAEKQRALPEEKPSDWFATQKEIYEQEENSVPNAEREELIQRLKAMAEEEVLPPGQRPWGGDVLFSCSSKYDLHIYLSAMWENRERVGLRFSL